jgi:Uma2 family endonuclease
VPFRFSADDDIRMAGEGYFADRDVELVEGEIRELNAVQLPHRAAQTQLIGLLFDVLDVRRVILEPMVRFSDRTVRQPDICVLAASYPNRRTHVAPDEVGIGIEVADTTLSTDLGEKLRHYAKAGIVRYWVVDVNGRAVHDFTRSDRRRYRDCAIVKFGVPISVAPLADTAITLPVGGFF